MSKATDADATSAPTVEQSENTEPSVEARGTARALTVRDNEHTNLLYGTDRTTTRAILDEAHKHGNTDVRSVELARFGSLLQIMIHGNVVLSHNDVIRAINTNTYEVSNFLSHASGSVEITLKTP